MQMKKGLIIGLGNVLKGDFGIGCYILEALGLGLLGDRVELAYLGDDPRGAAGLIYRWRFLLPLMERHARLENSSGAQNR